MQGVFEPIAPAGLPAVTLTEGSSAVEHAIFAAMAERGADSRFSALGFAGARHGSSIALSQFAAVGANDLGWPCIAYPESLADEAKILESVRSALGA